MNNEPYGFIYITTNMINGKKYIGQRRYYKGWEKYLGSGVNITRAIKKYGVENFKKDIIYIADSQKELNEKEMFYIDKYNALEDNNFYNIAKGGYSNPLEGKTDDEIKSIHNKIAISLKGKKFSESHIENLKKKPKTYRNKAVRRKHIDKICKSLIGNKNGKGNRGIKLSEEHRDKISKAHFGMKYDDNFKEKMRKIRSIKVICINTNQIFESAKKAGEFYNIGASHITQCCRGNAKTCGKLNDGTKLKWKYYCPE